MIYLTIAEQRVAEAMIRTLEVHQRLGDHHHCIVEFSRYDLERMRLSEFLGQSLSIETDKPGGGVGKIFQGFIAGGRLGYHLFEGSVLVLEAVSDSAKLDWSRREAYYRHQNLSAVARELAGKNGIKIFVHGNGPELNYVQRGETDFEFLKRIADDYGCFVRASGGGVEVRNGFNSGGIRLAWHEDLLVFRVRGHLTAPSVRGAYYDAKKKDGARYQTSSQNGVFSGAYDDVASAVKDASLAVFHSQEQLEHFNARAVILPDYKKVLEKESARSIGSGIMIEGTSRNPDLIPGDYVTIEGTPDGAGQYGLIEVLHHYDARHGYRNDFQATPWLAYTSPTKPERVLSHGYVTAVVVENDDPEDLGRLRIRYHWQTQGETSWTRTVVPYAGKERGVMFLPEVGDEVVVAFENGDPERPVVIGSVWNGKDRAPRSRQPYRGADFKKNEIKRVITKSGNTVQILDTPGKEVVEIFTAKRDGWIQLNNDKRVIAAHAEKDILIEAPNGEVRITCRSLVVDVSKDASTSVGGNQTTQAQGSHTLEVKGNLSETSGKSVTINASIGMDQVASAKYTMIGKPVDINPLVPPIRIPVPIVKPPANASEWKPGDALKEGGTTAYDLITNGFVPVWPTPEAMQWFKELKEAKTPAEKRESSERLGNEAAKYYLCKKLGKNIQDFQVFDGRDVFNVVYQDPTTGKVYVLEAKGGKSHLGTRKGKGGKGSITQGSPEYLELIVSKLKHNKYKGKGGSAEGKLRKQMGSRIKIAYIKGKCEYIGVRGDYDLDPPAHLKEPKEIFKLPK